MTPGCATFDNVGRESGGWGTELLIHERFEALCAEVKLRPAVDVRLVVENDLNGAWGYAQNKGDQYLIAVSLKKLQWQPEMVEPTLRHEMAHILSRDFSHGEQWASACSRLGIAATLSQPVKTASAVRTSAAFSNRKIR